MASTAATDDRSPRAGGAGAPKSSAGIAYLPDLDTLDAGRDGVRMPEPLKGENRRMLGFRSWTFLDGARCHTSGQYAPRAGCRRIRMPEYTATPTRHGICC